MISRQIKPELNTKPPTSQPGPVYHMMEGALSDRNYHGDLDNKDIRGFYKPDSMVYSSVHMPGRVIVPNQTNMQGIPNHQIQQPQPPPRIIPRYSRYNN